MTSLEYAVDDHVATITLNRPNKQNSLDPEMVIRLASAWTAIRNDPDVRVAVITANGSSFCAGGDLGRLIPIITGARMPEGDWEEKLAANRGMLNHALLREFDCDKPVIAAVNGHAVAGGLEIVLGTDIRVAAAGARFGLQEARWGVFPGGGGTVRLPAQVPHCIAMEMLLCADLVNAEDAYRFGLVNYVLPQSEVLPKAIELARRIAANAPLSVQAIRRSAKASRGLEERAALGLETEFAKPVWRSNDAKEGPRAFMEKRSPRYLGR